MEEYQSQDLTKKKHYKKKIIIFLTVLLFVIVIIGFVITIYIPNLSRESQAGEVITTTKNIKVVKSFTANVKVIENFTEYQDENESIVLNKLEIVDDRTRINGLQLFSSQSLDDVKIEILPCLQMPQEPSKNEQVLGDCFEISPGTVSEFSKSDYLVFPERLFESVGDYNFENSNKEGGVYIRHFVDLEERDEKFYTGNHIKKDMRYVRLFDPKGDMVDSAEIYFSEYGYFNGYYYIGFQDVLEKSRKIEEEFGEEIHVGGGGYFKKDEKVFIKIGEDKILLEGISPDGFDVIYLGESPQYTYYKDNFAIFHQLIKYKQPCGHHVCTYDVIEITKVLDIENKIFIVYDKDKQIIKVDDDFYLLNDSSIYEIDLKDSKFNYFLDKGYILSKNRIVYLQHNKELEGVDLETFKDVGSGYFVDKNNLYGYERVIDFKFDYETIALFESGLAKDKNGVYLNFKKSDLVDIESFEKIACKDRGCYFKDKDNVYYNLGHRDYFENFEIKPDAETFEYLENMLAKDKNNLYDGNNIVEMVDIESFERIGYYTSFVYFKDRDNYYKSAGTWIKQINEQEVPFGELRDY